MNVDDLQDLLVKEWYAMSREMKQFIPITFPYFTFQGFMQEAGKESEQRKTDDVAQGNKTLG